MAAAERTACVEGSGGPHLAPLGLWGGHRRALWRTFCSDPVLRLLDRLGVRAAGDFANAFEESGAVRDWLKHRMPMASDDDISGLVAGWEQARVEVDVDVALAPHLSNADPFGGGNAQVGGVQCISTSVASTQVSIPSASGAGELVAVPKKRMRRDAGVDTTRRH